MYSSTHTQHSSSAHHKTNTCRCISHEESMPYTHITPPPPSHRHPKSAPRLALLRSNTPSVPLDSLCDLRPVHASLPENQIPQNQISIFGPERFLATVDNDAITPPSTRRHTTTLFRGRRGESGNWGVGCGGRRELLCDRGHG